MPSWSRVNVPELPEFQKVFGPHTPARIAIGCSSLLFGARAEFDCVAYRG